MRAVLYNAFKGKISVEDVPVPVVPDDGALIKVHTTGICRSDWWGWQGFDKSIRLPHVPGHEFAGEVAVVGPNVRQYKLGDRVTAPFVCGCSTCGWCKAGQPQVCPTQTQPGFTHWGSFAEYVVVRNADFNLVSLPDEISYISAASMGCRFGTAYRAIVSQGGLTAGDSLIVMGCGGVGLSAIMLANAIGADVVAVDISDEKLDFARKIGAAHTINIAQEEYAPSAMRILLDDGATMTIDAIGKPEIVDLCIRSLRPQGKHLQVGLMEGEMPSITMSRLISNEIQLIGSHGVQATAYPEMFELINSGACDPKHLISGIISLEQSPRVVQRFAEAPPIGVGLIDLSM